HHTGRNSYPPGLGYLILPCRLHVAGHHLYLVRAAEFRSSWVRYCRLHQRRADYDAIYRFPVLTHRSTHRMFWMPITLEVVRDQNGDREKSVALHTTPALPEPPT